MSAPTHTPVDLTDEQRANLAKLAAKHTRGPWSVDGPLPGSDNPNLGLWDVEGGTNVCCGATLADAHLIAAAPEMLEALEEATLALEEASKLLFAKGLQGCASIMLAHRDKARAAIAKVTGYSSALAALNDETNEMVALSNGRLG